MSQMWMNKYKPQTLDDYVGDQYQTILYYLDEFFKGKRSKGFILYGLPGAGKSALINAICDHYNADMYVVNASDDRNNLSFNSINAKSLTGNKRITILEEVDGLNPKQFKKLSKIIEISQNPIILICNDIKLIDNIVKQKCYIKEITVNKFALKSLANKIIKQENLDINKDKLNKDLVFIKSYRGLLDYLQFGYTSEMGLFGITENLKDIITFTNDNSESPKLISLADIYLKRSQQGYKNGNNISKFILENIDMKSDNYPRTYRFLGGLKKDKIKSGTIKITGFK